MIFNPPGQIFQKRLHIFTSPGGGDIQGGSAKFGRTLDDNHRKALVGQAEGSGHAGNAPADNQSVLVDFNRQIRYRFQQRRPGDSHSYQVFGLFGGHVLVRGMHPGALVADIGHVKQVSVHAGITDGFLKQRFVGPGCTGSHHNAVEFLFANDFNHFVLGVLTAGEKVLFGIHDMRQGSGIVRDRWDIGNAADIDAAVADKNTDARRLTGNVIFGGKLFIPDQGPSG